jgi:hypothetical protein
MLSYDLWRHLLGVAEGPEELGSGTLVPLEANLVGQLFGEVCYLIRHATITLLHSVLSALVSYFRSVCLRKKRWALNKSDLPSLYLGVFAWCVVRQGLLPGTGAHCSRASYWWGLVVLCIPGLFSLASFRVPSLSPVYLPLQILFAISLCPR